MRSALPERRAAGDALRATRTAVLDGYMLNALDALPRGAELTEPPVCVADGGLNLGAVWRAQVIVWSQVRTE